MEAVGGIRPKAVEAVGTIEAVDAVGAVRPEAVEAVGAIEAVQAVGVVRPEAVEPVGTMEAVEAVGVVHHSVAVVAVETFGATVVAVYCSVDSEHDTAAVQEG